MGQKTHPIGFRLGTIRGWDSNWYARKKEIAEKLLEDEELRRYLTVRLKRAGLSRVVIERTPKRIILTLHTSRPGVVIGRGGQEVEKLREELKRITTKEIQININEIKRPELDASLVAQNVAQQLEGRVAFRRAMKQALQGAMRMGAQGIRIRVSGRLGGAEMGRVEQYLEGRVPLHTIRADIDYAEATAFSIYGTTGVKVWVYRGEILGRPDLSPNVQAQRQQLRQMQSGSLGSESSKARDRRRGGRRRRDNAQGAGRSSNK